MKRIILLQFLFLLFCIDSEAQSPKLQITGKVLDNDTKQTMVGVSVALKGTKSATMTDNNGVFKLNIATGAQVLVFKYIGYETKEVNINGSSSITVQLSPSSNALQEVVVNVGYGKSISRDKLASAVSSVSAKDLADFPVGTAAEALAGKLAGVSVKATEGAPGSDIQIVVRGGTSLTQDNAPLYIVDGVPLERALSIISPNEIETIDVLKDVASTAIYGARGANGVVLITTKSGRKGRTIISFDAFAGSRNLVNELKVLRPYDFVNYQYELSHRHYNGFAITDTAALNGFDRNYGKWSDLEIYKSFPMVNWQDKIFGRNALSNTQILNLTGGTDATTYNFTLNNTSEQGVMLNSGLKRTFASFRFDNKISSKLRLGLNVRYSRQRVDGAGTSNTGSSSNNRLKYSVRFQPYEGTISFEEYDPNAIFDNTINLSNPLTSALTDVRNAYSNALITSGQVVYSPIQRLTIRSVVGYTVNDSKNDNFSGVANYSVSSRNSSSQYASQPYISLSTNNGVNISNSNTLSFNPRINKNNTLDILLGQEINQNNSRSFNQTIKYFPAAVTAEQAFANIQQANPPAGAIQPSPTTDIGGDRLFSFFGRMMYSYKSKYNLNLMLRRDGSSKFGPEHRWGTFPSAQFAWRMSEEQFMKKLNLSWLDNLKFRASYGTAGNNRVSSDRLFATIFTTSATSAGYAATDNSQTAGLYSANLANADLKWETTISRNIGLDFSLFKGRFTTSVDAYVNRTNDLLLQANVPQSIGYIQQYKNVGSTRNKGVEVQLSGVVINRKSFTYNSSFNISMNKNTILSLQDGSKGYAVSSGWGQSGEDFYVEVGKPVGQFYGYVTDGFYTLDDFDRAKSNPVGNKWVLKPGVADAGAILGQSIYPGVIKFKKTTVGGDSVITTKDKTVLGNVQPLFYGGWNNQFSYKGFDMSVFVNFSYGNKTYNANTIEFSSAYQANGNNLLAKFKDRWKSFDDNGVLMTDWDQIAEVNKNAKIYMPTRGSYQVNSDAIEDASFLRISNVTLGYSMPASIMQRIRTISKLRVFATVNNLHTFTRYSGFDPEANTRRNNPLTPGVDYSAYPRNRYILAGINLIF
ncbi:MAG: TonB-dependent receptor [Candidatus Pedobacter colombiensis]|uniref:TonB-dependent receptor n=1 Tax=Candidatus Pedobacter colombiensis TaxID=3121371 RepID=A0AAJ5W7H0_9SPHI|nr:TonB-dependent receptor [Pedobacter sp.]WEK18490.1 MAG: TonB-dependent receptor [Pedobacter sp.]